MSTVSIPKRGGSAVVADDFDKPNGIAFSPDEQNTLCRRYRGFPPRGRAASIRAFTVSESGSVRRPGLRVDRTGLADGFRLDTDGNVWTSAGEGVHCFSPNGDPPGRSGFRRWFRTSPSADRNGTGCSSPPRRRFTVFMSAPSGRGGSDAESGARAAMTLRRRYLGVPLRILRVVAVVVAQAGTVGLVTAPVGHDLLKGARRCQ